MLTVNQYDDHVGLTESVDLAYRAWTARCAEVVRSGHVVGTPRQWEAAARARALLIAALDAHEAWLSCAVAAANMAPEGGREVYASPNGDRWLLVRDDGGRLLVRHEPNLASGGRASETEVAAFLACSGNGPEYQELRRLMTAAVEHPAA